MIGRVLVVDDDAALCELVQAVLVAAGLNVVALTESGDALRQTQREKFDAIFLDVNMPPPDGLEVARRVRASGYNQKTPIVMIAGSSDPNLQAQCFQAGANFFLYKPFDRQRLLRILRVTQSTIQQERRRFQRVHVRCKVTVHSQGAKAEGTTLDMSLNGLLVQASRAFPMGSAVDVSLIVSTSASPVNASGRVARVIGEDCMGIQLDKMSAADSERLQDFLLPLILAITGPEQPILSANS